MEKYRFCTHAASRRSWDNFAIHECPRCGLGHTHWQRGSNGVSLPTRVFDGVALVTRTKAVCQAVWPAWHALGSGPPKRRKSHARSCIFAIFGLKKHKIHTIGPDLEGPRGQTPYLSYPDLDLSEKRPVRDAAACRSDPTFTRASPGLAVAEQLPQINTNIIQI